MNIRFTIKKAGEWVKGERKKERKRERKGRGWEQVEEKRNREKGRGEVPKMRREVDLSRIALMTW
jgi:hypothetical protein